MSVLFKKNNSPTFDKLLKSDVPYYLLLGIFNSLFMIPIGWNYFDPEGALSRDHSFLGRNVEFPWIRRETRLRTSCRKFFGKQRWLVTVVEHSYNKRHRHQGQITQGHCSSTTEPWDHTNRQIRQEGDLSEKRGKNRFFLQPWEIAPFQLEKGY